MFLKKKIVDPKKLFKEYKEGMSLGDLAERYSYSPTGIRQIMIEYDAQRWFNTKRWGVTSLSSSNKKLAPKFFEAYKSDMSLKEVAAKFGYTFTHVRQLMILNDQQQYNKLKKNRGRPVGNKDRNKEIIRLCKQGKKAREIGNAFNLSIESIRKIAVKEGLVKIFKRKIERRNYNIIRDLRRGISIEKIADKYNLNKSTIVHYRIKNNIPSIYQIKIKIRNKKIMKLLKSGIPSGKIASMFNITGPNLQHIASSHGFPLRKTAIRTPKIKLLLKKNFTPRQIADKLQITTERVYQVRREMQTNVERHPI